MTHAKRVRPFLLDTTVGFEVGPAHTCSDGTQEGWYHLICGCGAFWSSFSIAPRIDAREFNVWVSRVRTATLDLRLHLDILYFAPMAEDQLCLDDIAAYFDSSVERCRRLYVHAEDFLSLPLVLDAFRSSRLELMTSLSLSRLRAFLDYSSTDDAPVSGIFPVRYPPLTFLRLSDFVFSWAEMCQFDSLTTLVLHKLFGSLQPSCMQLATLFRCIQALERLSLRCVDCCGSPIDVDSVIALPRLSVLDISFDGHVGLASFLSHCDFPSLTTFSIIMDDPIDTTLLLDCCSVLKPVTTFVASGYVSRSEIMGQVYRSLPSMTTLDLSGGSRSMFFPFLKDESTPTGILCPRLADVTVSEVSMRELKNFVSRRVVNAVRLARIDAHYSYQYSHRPSYKDYVVQNVGALRIDPPFTFPVDWVFE
ncbi:hypothetical protein DFH06DRAFT_1138602 [Mycena polygramma]|nr:hypothetical protein DFH06DRAFT_1138602 [Mycena polygramma]